ncbi:SET domain containing protein [Acanthamoeba castellanii str. Neff]|uniref:SET domain containing protein n=1 Tax=Acanthamoeba castellanii (strain ATCC 30010 / Neff) TaxID=1257118 RepID=L8GIU8_ACACF|nr:SET domain containing protein [Acanthamoeba castellanii str. Neff]ELR12668.1 SET domain containing protein [Acanthamoeba castellanii str. Neff]
MEGAHAADHDVKVKVHKETSTNDPPAEEYIFGEDDEVIFIGSVVAGANSRMSCEEVLPPVKFEEPSTSEPEQETEQESKRKRGRPRGKRRSLFSLGRPSKPQQEAAPTDQSCCALCRMDDPSLGDLKRVGIGRYGRKPLWAHSECLHYASRKTEDESDPDLVTRAIYHALPCKRCKKKRATMGCRIERCPYACHYPCAIESGGEYVDNVGFYCPGHVHIAKKQALTLTKWPTESPVQYTAVNIWDDIDTEDIEFIAAHSHHWEQYTPTYLNQNLASKVFVQEIFFGHWAYCTNLRKQGIAKQYEVRALVDIESEDMIGEYVGRVRYQKDIEDSQYVANFWYPPELGDLGDKQLCLDAEHEGNEMRFVNSVAPTTAFYIRQNATMSTLWCRNQLRVVLTATKKILKGQPIIVNYNEFSSSFFEENMPFLPRFTINIPPIPPEVLASGKKSALAQLLPPALPPHETKSPATLAIKQEPSKEEGEEVEARVAKRPRLTTDQTTRQPPAEVIVID